MVAELRQAGLFGCFVLLLISFAVLFFVPLGKGDLPGYDDALYAHIAKRAALSGDWLHLQSNGYPALEHPPLLPWMETVLFTIFGISDAAARVPSAVCGFGTVLLVWWLARRLLADEAAALWAMFSMGMSIYFLKYAARAMTDVPFAFFFLCAVCCWAASDRRPAWLIAAGLFTAAAQMTRGMMGLALPLAFFVDWIWSRRRVHPAYAAAAALIAFAPPALWYWHLASTYGEFFHAVHAQFLSREITTPSLLKPLIFAWMLAKSYWPWFPAMLAGLYLSRSRILLIWIGSIFAACLVVRNPVLRYLLPAYPAFAVASGAALRRWLPRSVLLYVAPVLALGIAAVAAWMPQRHDAAELRQMAGAAAGVTKPDERVAFYDEGAPRFDESNLLQWYGSRDLYILENRAMLDRMLSTETAQAFIVDRAAFAETMASRYNCIATGNHFCTALRKP